MVDMDDEALISDSRDLNSDASSKFQDASQPVALGPGKARRLQPDGPGSDEFRIHEVHEDTFRIHDRMGATHLLCTTAYDLLPGFGLGSVLFSAPVGLVPDRQIIAPESQTVRSFQDDGAW